MKDSGGSGSEGAHWQALSEEEGGVTRRRADLQLVLQFLDRVTLCLTPRLKEELRQARPLLADKQCILSLSAHLASGEGDEQMREWGRQSGKERESDRAKGGERET